MMQWFYQIPGVETLNSPESFFHFFSVPYQPSQLSHCRFPVLATFHRRLRAEVPLRNLLETEDPARDAWLLARRLLAESYQQQIREQSL